MTALDLLLVCSASLLLGAALCGAVSLLVATASFAERVHLPRPVQHSLLALIAVGGTTGLFVVWVALLPWLARAN